MIILSNIQIFNFKNIKNTSLNDLKDINIIIGPNNCGKTNVLEAIKRLKTFKSIPYSHSTCKYCDLIRGQNLLPQYICIKNDRDAFENQIEPDIIFSFNEKYLEGFNENKKNSFEEFLERVRIVFKQKQHSQETAILENINHVREWKNKIALQGHGAELISTHAVVIDSKIMNGISKSILECPEDRLRTYKGVEIAKYAIDKNLEASNQQKVHDSINRTIDSNLASYRTGTLDYLRGKNRFQTPISEQGSGVRSMECLITDIVSENESNIILIDEPELGLNPAAIREFIEFLKQEMKNKQIFITTHDPTFVNPKLWDKEKLCIYLFSIVENGFVKIDLNKNFDDPNTFAGYLAHTTCLGDFHLYVEGKFDVYIHQIFLRKYLENLKQTKKKRNFNFFEIMNRIMIYHLGGSFCEHLLHTVPKYPYRALLLFDGDIKSKVQEKIKMFNLNRWKNLPEFQFCETIEQIHNTYISNKNKKKELNKIPVYCLSKNDIEDYLQPKPNNKTKGPDIALNMTFIPDEILKIYDEIIRIL